MPELPEVETTARGVKRRTRGTTITEVWTDYYSEFHLGKNNIKDPSYFKKFRRAVLGATITDAGRRGKNVLIYLSTGKIILVHMKMTGHLLYGAYRKEEGGWRAADRGPLRDDPYNRFVHVVFSLSDGKHLVLSDLRKFARVTLVDKEKLATEPDVKDIGPEPLATSFTFAEFSRRFERRPRGAVKTVLMDQTIIAGIGNIYSDEILWRAGIHPLQPVATISRPLRSRMYQAMKKILQASLGVGGDSESDYRDIDGRPGKFQRATMAYDRTGEHCKKTGCPGTIQRMVIGGRSAHFCDKHQRLVKGTAKAVS